MELSAKTLAISQTCRDISINRGYSLLTFMVTYQRKNLQYMTTSERLGYVRLEKCVRQVGDKTVREGVHIDSPRNLRCPSDGGELSQLRSGIAQI